mmetsp:Transcript_1458/g.4282  ORF Transcript_1458/g.4282 Transcript_1458/m.4282 type:complete len:269 (+) Transcript_1458:102-908(+)
MRTRAYTNSRQQPGTLALVRGAHRLEEVRHVLLGRLLHDAMAQVEDVIGRKAARLLDDLVHVAVDGLLVGEEHAGVHVALHRQPGRHRADALTRVYHVHRPVHREAIAAEGGHALQQPARAEDVQRDGQVGVRLLDGRYDLLDVWHGKHLKIGRGQVGRPAVEDLHHLRAVVRLVAHVVGDRLRQRGQERVQHLGLLEHHVLDHRVVAARAALDDVRRQREGRAHKAQYGRVGVNLVAQDAQRLANEGASRVRVQRLDLLDAVHRADG